ncbi:unnamed protein product [Adineta steineri]|uniref:Uncharacterized protein n=1 Tax=Adineta steineri TaxID=433720 RepID=A0A813PHA7_9BILA|nr:unnamed protein product [Adineta steineri]CAF0754976.1 unnamed protein product [Adineta steineri]
MNGSELKGAFRGETRRSLRSGFGVYQYSNPFFRYEGTWHEGKKQGFGKLLFGDGSYYQGEFVDNEITGQGTRYFATSRNTYTGHFYYGEMDGHGRLRLGNGDCYEGNFKSNTFEGEGSYLSYDKQLYTGTWHKNRRHGQGEQTYTDGTRYSGDWIADKRHGFGKLTNGQDESLIYEGSWRNDLMHGEGTYSIGETYTYRNAMLINSYPTGWPFRLCINKDKASTLLLTENPITITIDIVDSSENNNNRVKADCGRLIRLRCGQRTDHPTSDSLPTPFGFHVNLIARSTKASSSNDQSISELNEQSGGDEVKESIEDSMLAASDEGRAQFVGINTDTFPIHLPNSSSSVSNSQSSTQPSASKSSRHKAEKSATSSSIIFIIDDVTYPIPFDKALDTVYIPVQFSNTNNTQ